MEFDESGMEMPLRLGLEVERIGGWQRESRRTARIRKAGLDLCKRTGMFVVWRGGRVSWCCSFVQRCWCIVADVGLHACHC